MTRADGTSPSKLGDIITKSVTGDRPSNGDFYVRIWASTDLNAPLPKDTCVDAGLWSFLRKFAGLKKSGAAILVARIQPTSDATQTALVVPVFSTSASEISSTGEGSKCVTTFFDRALTYSYGSNLNPEFSIDLEMNFTDDADSVVTQKIMDYATTLMSLIGSASGTPAALVTQLADPHIKQLSADFDNALKDHWKTSTDLKYSTSLTARANATSPDKIVFKMRTVNAGSGGPTVGQWAPGGSLYLEYKPEKLKDGNVWKDRNSIMVMPLVPNAPPAGQTSLADMIRNGTVTGGFTEATLKSQSTPQGLHDQCELLSQFLTRILIPSDVLAAKYAVLRNSAYNTYESIRADSECFEPGQLQQLAQMRADYVFPTNPRVDAAPRNAQVIARMDPVRRAFVSGNASRIAALAVEPISDFSFVSGQSASDYKTGDAAIQVLAGMRLTLSCYQASPTLDVSSVIALASVGNSVRGVVVSFNDAGKFDDILLAAPEDAAAAIGVPLEKWVDPKNNYACNK